MAKVLIGFVILLAALWAVTLWRAGQRERMAEAEYPPIGSFVEVAGLPVHYVQQGEGPDLVLIHGASGNLRDFTFDMVDRLSDRYRVTVFDRPGLGYSGSPDGDSLSITDQAAVLSRAASSLGVTRPVVLGQSYGGAVALAWAVHHPDRIAALVPVAAASNPWDSALPPYYRITSSWLGGLLAVPFITAYVPEGVVESAVEEVFEPQAAVAGYGDYVGAGLTLRRATIRSNARQRASLLTEIEALHHRYDEIAVPTEIVHGDADTTVWLQVHSVPLSRQIRNATLTVLDGVGHMPHHVRAEAVEAAIDRAAARAGVLNKR